MPNYERGVYEPSDEVRVFDGTEEDEDMEGSRLPLLIVLALLVLAMFAGLVWLAYTQGVARGRSETPVLAAASGPVRVAPSTPGGADQTYKGFKIYEQPAPPDEEGATVTPPPETPKPVAAAPAPEAAKVAAPEPAPVPKPVAITPAPPKPAPVIAAAPKPAPAIKKAVLPPVPAAPAGPATGAPRPLVAAAPAAGAYVLQIGAYKSQADADAAWKTYRSRHAALLTGYGPDVRQADLGEKGTWYRLRVAGFADRDVALALCDRLKADGGVCILGK